VLGVIQRHAASFALLVLSGIAIAGQSVTSLQKADQDRLEAQRAVVLHYLDEAGRAKFATAPGKLGTLRALLAAKVFKPDQTYELQSMGVVLGDVFVQDMGFTWVIVSDEHGRDPAIRFGNTSVILYPLTMISKRIERGETIDVFALYNGLADQAQQLIENERGAK
jgi:hypothetical protein